MFSFQKPKASKNIQILFSNKTTAKPKSKALEGAREANKALVNRLVQTATPAQAERLLKQRSTAKQLTNKQKIYLQEISCERAASTRHAVHGGGGAESSSRAKIDNSLATIRKDEVKRIALTAAKMVTSVLPPQIRDYRASPDYAALYASMGGPDQLPPPRPVLSRDLSGERIAYGKASTAYLTFDVPAGSGYLILFYPHLIKNPLRVYNLADSTTAKNWGTSQLMTDTSVTPLTQTDWIVHDPLFGLLDSNMIKNAATGTVYASSGQAQGSTLSQVLATMIRAQVVVPYNGQCATTVFTTSADPTRFGHAAAPIHAHPDSLITLRGSIPDAYRMHIRQPSQMLAATSLPSLAGQCCQPVIQNGSSSTASRAFVVTGQPTGTWHRQGYIDSVDAPDGAQGNASNSHVPRDSFQHAINHGFIYVLNTGAVSVTVSVNACASMAGVVRSDDQEAAIGAVMSQLRANADTAIKRDPYIGSVSRVVTADSHEAARHEFADNLVASGLPVTAARAIMSSEVHTPQLSINGAPHTKGDMVQDAAAVGGLGLMASQAGFFEKIAPTLQRFGNFLKSSSQSVLRNAPAIMERVAPVVEFA